MECRVCGRYAEGHHIIFRSQAKYLEDVPDNKTPLCYEHHRGNSSPHKCKKRDLELKREYQAKLKEKFTQKYYSPDEIKNILRINDKTLLKVLKKLPVHSEGYERNELIVRLMGGKIYDTCD